MIKLQNREYFRKVWARAKEMGLRAQLKDLIGYLHKYGCQDDPKRTQCVVGYDWAPLSFGFLMKIRNDQTGEYEPWFNGGLIWHEHEKRWGIHT